MGRASFGRPHPPPRRTWTCPCPRCRTFGASPLLSRDRASSPSASLTKYMHLAVCDLCCHDLTKYMHQGSKRTRRGDGQERTGEGTSRQRCARKPDEHRPDKLFTLLDLCVSSLRRGHANLLCIVPVLTDDPRRESNKHRPEHRLRCWPPSGGRACRAAVRCATAGVGFGMERCASQAPG